MLYDQNCGRLIFGNTALFLLATRVLPASPNFGQAKHGQKGPAATFRPKGVCSPMCTGLFTFYSPSHYPSSLSSWRPKSKKFPFFTNFHFPLVKNFVACYRFNFDAFDLPHRKFKPLYHKSWSACCLPQKGKTKNSVRGYIGEDKCFAIDFNGNYINDITMVFISFYSFSAKTAPEQRKT